MPSFFKYTSDRVSPGTVIAGVIKNAALHVGTADEQMNRGVSGWLERVIRAVGEDPNDPTTTWSFTSFHVPRASRDESSAGNPAHLLLILVTLGFLGAAGWRRAGPEGLALALGLVGAFVAFAGVLKWQPWHVRLHLPLFVLWSPLIALALASLLPRALVWVAGGGLVLLAVGPAFRNELRPLVAYWNDGFSERHRESRYFAGLRHLERSFRAAGALVDRSGCGHVGLDLSSRVGDQQEYVLLHLLGADRGQRVVRALGVTNRSKAYRVEVDEGQPCAVVCVFCEPADGWVAPYRAIGQPIPVSDDVVVFVAPREGPGGR
jgi:hypothetical protein